MITTLHNDELKLVGGGINLVYLAEALHLTFEGYNWLHDSFPDAVKDSISNATQTIYSMLPGENNHVFQLILEQKILNKAVGILFLYAAIANARKLI